MKTEEYLQGRQDGYLLGYKAGVKYAHSIIENLINDKIIEVSMGKRSFFSVADVVDLCTKLKEVKR